MSMFESRRQMITAGHHEPTEGEALTMLVMYFLVVCAGLGGVVLTVRWLMAA